MSQSKFISTFVNTPATWYLFVPSFFNAFVQIKVVADVRCVDGFWDIDVKSLTFPGYFAINFDQTNKSYLYELIDQAVIDEYINQKEDNHEMEWEG